VTVFVVTEVDLVLDSPYRGARGALPHRNDQAVPRSLVHHAGAGQAVRSLEGNDGGLRLGPELAVYR
jgi:hypothetical protein